MALTTILRRSASTAVPFASRLIGRQNFHHHHHPAPAAAAAAALFFSAGGKQSQLSGHLSPATSTSFPSAVRCYCSKSDESLLRFIEDEIKCAEETDEHDGVEETPDGFPFELEDNPGQQTVTLNREYQGETIAVEVHMPTLVTGEDDEQNEDDDEETERGNDSSLPLVVRVSKRTGPCLEFGCTAYPDEISIDSLSVKDPDNAEDQIAYEGPDFEDLDENLQKAFLKYLEIRGVKPSATNFLHEYMINKDSREYLNWLKNLKKFVEA